MHIRIQVVLNCMINKLENIEMYESAIFNEIIHFAISENCITQCHEWTYIENTFDAVKGL